MKPDRSTVELSFAGIKKHLIAAMYVILLIILLCTKWTSLWGYKMSLFSLIDELGSLMDSAGFILIGTIAVGLGCLFSLVRAETNGGKIEQVIGFALAALFSAIFMIIIAVENGDWGALGIQLSAAPTAELIIAIVGIIVTLVDEGKETTKRIVPEFVRREPEKRSGRSCPHCGGSVPAGCAFCPKCGKPLSSGETATRVLAKCPHCGAEIDSEDVFCGFCGKNTREKVAPVTDSEPGPILKKKTETSVPRKKKCANCGSMIDADLSFCPMCGKNPDAAETSTETKTRTKGFSIPTDLG